jgi:pimeloyl-ACP methyl ester carboxylesterase
MVPGLGLTSEAWEPTVRSLLREGVGAPSVSVTTLPGYGEPLRPGDPIAPADAARRLLDTSILPGRQYLLLGHSSSCQVVAHAAALAPERVAGLVLVGPTTDPRAATWPRLARRWLANAARETPRQIPRVQRQYRRTTLRAMVRIMDAARRDRIDRTLDAVTCPVRIVRGPHDRIVPEDWCRGLASTVTLPRGAHMVPITDHDLLAHEVLSHLGFVQSRT